MSDAYYFGNDDSGRCQPTSDSCETVLHILREYSQDALRNPKDFGFYNESCIDAKVPSAESVIKRRFGRSDSYTMGLHQNSFEFVASEANQIIDDLKATLRVKLPAAFKW